MVASAAMNGVLRTMVLATGKTRSGIERRCRWGRCRRSRHHLRVLERKLGDDLGMLAGHRAKPVRLSP